MKKMMCLIVFAMGSVGSIRASLVYPIEFQNRSGENVEIWLYDKSSNTPYSTNTSSPSSISIGDGKKATFNIGSTDLVKASIIGAHVRLSVDLVAPHKGYYINQSKKGGPYVTHDSAKSILTTGTAFNVQ